MDGSERNPPKSCSQRRVPSLVRRRNPEQTPNYVFPSAEFDLPYAGYNTNWLKSRIPARERGSERFNRPIQSPSASPSQSRNIPDQLRNTRADYRTQSTQHSPSRGPTPAGPYAYLQTAQPPASGPTAYRADPKQTPFPSQRTSAQIARGYHNQGTASNSPNTQNEMIPPIQRGSDRYALHQPFSALLPRLPANASRRIHGFINGDMPDLTIGNVNVAAADALSLRAESELYDSVIDGYLVLINRRLQANGNNNVRMAPTVIAQVMDQRNIDAIYVRDTLLGGEDLFAKDVLYFPYNDGGAHWMLMVVNFPQQTIKAYDSIGSVDHTQTMNDFFHFLSNFYNQLQPIGMTRNRGQLQRERWRLENINAGVPTQRSLDCGVFVCQFVNYLCGQAGEEMRGDLDRCFTAVDMQYFRQRMALQLLDQRVDIP